MYGTLEEGCAFGEGAILFGKRNASIIASKGSNGYVKYMPQGARYVDEPRITLCRLSGDIIKNEMSEKELASLKKKVEDVMEVFDYLSGKIPR